MQHLELHVNVGFENSLAGCKVPRASKEIIAFPSCFRQVSVEKLPAFSSGEILLLSGGFREGSFNSTHYVGDAHARLSADQRNQLHEADSRAELDLDLVVQRIHLPVIHQDKESVALKSLDCLPKLLLPVNLPPLPHLISVQDLLGIRRL